MQPLTLVLAFVAALGIFFIVFGIASRPTTRVDLLEDRLTRFSEHDDPNATLRDIELSVPFLDRTLRPFLTRLNNALASRVAGSQQQALSDKINLAGRPWNLTVGGFVALRLATTLLLAILLYAAGSLSAMETPIIFLPPMAGMCLGYVLPTLVLSRKVRKRQREILKALPSALDLLTISVEAGLAFDAALARVTEKFSTALSGEFTQVLREIRLGRPRVDALEEMEKRIKVPEVTGFVQAIIQSDQLGVGIANTLRIQSEEIRRRRRQRAEEAGQKAPLKMLFPMVGCIFPTLFIVLLGPALLQVIGAK